jgi:hypothetical protein
VTREHGRAKGDGKRKRTLLVRICLCGVGVDVGDLYSSPAHSQWNPFLGRSSVVVEVHDTKDRSILLAGVMDGHLGKAASSEVQKHLPQKFSEELLRGTGDGDTPIGSILQTAWEQTCDAYRFACSSGDECIAEYDPREGILMANTGSEDYAAGTTT